MRVPAVSLGLVVPQVCSGPTWTGKDCRDGVECQDYFPEGNKCTFGQKLWPLYIAPNLIPIGIGAAVLLGLVIFMGGRR